MKLCGTTRKFRRLAGSGLQALLVGCLCVANASMAAGQPPKPARVVTQYALTSSFDLATQNPQDWRLLGSNDGGKSWTVLDIRTNEAFSAASQRRVFATTNQTAYNIYRLQVDKGNRPDSDNPASVQLSEIELMGPVVGVTNEADLQMLITASCAHPVVGPPENAFDGDLSTRWADFGLGQPNGCWIQCQYVLHSELLITNISQAQVADCLWATRELLADREPIILSNLADQAVKPVRVLAGYALTSANDWPTRDPRDWRLLGSKDGGKTWITLDVRHDEIFSTRFQRRVFMLTNEAACSLYRLQIDAVGVASGMVQLGEIEPLYASSDTNARTSMVVSALTENPPKESADMAFDGDSNTKWLSFAGVSPDHPNWIQWQYIAEQPDLPVIDLHRLDSLIDQSRWSNLTAQASSLVRTLTGYALTSADDAPERDPRDWRLLGSNDGGKTWAVLDVRRNESFASRFQRRVFTMAKPAAYAIYRLQIDSVADPASANSVQLGGIEPLYAATGASTGFSVLVSAQGDNPPNETIEMAFDENPRSKWLDFARGNTNRASWVQWQYARGEDQPVVNLDRLKLAQPRKLPPLKLRLAGVVATWNSDSRILGLLDPSGFQLFKLGSAVGKVQPGDRVRLAGQLQLGKEPPTVADPELTVLGSLPRLAELRAEQPWDERQDFLLGAVEGKVTSVAQDRFYSTIRLAAENGSGYVLANILSPRRLPLPAAADYRLQVQGVVEPVFNENGQRVAGTIWVANLNSVSLAAPTEAEWNTWPEYSVQSLAKTNLPLLTLLRVRGTVVRESPGRSLVIGEGTNQIIAYSQSAVSLPAGAAVEAAGFFVRRSPVPVLYLACSRPAQDKTPVASAQKPAPIDDQHPLTDIREINHLLQNRPDKTVPLKVRGVITYLDMGLGDFYLQDGPDSLHFWGQLSAGLYPLLGQEGTRVEVKGKTSSDGIAVATSFATVLGKGRMPDPVRRSSDYLMTGQDDGKWVEVEGVITEADKQRLTLAAPGGQLIVWVNELDNNMLNRLLGSLVQVNGVCQPVLNARGQRMGIRLLVPSGKYIEIVNAAPANPFDLPLRPIGTVLAGDSDSSGLTIRLIKTAGIVTHKEPRLLFVQDGKDGLRVYTRQNTTVEPGDRVEVVGLAEPDGLTPKLIQALVRKTGRDTLPAAVPINPLGIELNSDEGDQYTQDAVRGQMEATFLGYSFNESTPVLELQHPKTKKPFFAYLPVSNNALPPIAVGSRVMLEGVFKAKTDTVADFGQTVTSFEMYLNSPADITVLEHPSWWTTQHLLWVLGGLGTVLVIVLAWVGSLRHRVQQRTGQLRAEIDEHKRTESKLEEKTVALEKEIEERKRMEEVVEKTHKDLLIASRQAGMAEVATSVLHNVGNVLNSVNVSTSLVSDQLRKSKLANLARAADLMREHAADLGEFMARDPKGQQLPGYLAQLAEHLTNEQTTVLGELDGLHKNIEHIKDIVAMQQSYAKVAGVTEMVNVADLVEDALRMNAGALTRHDVRIFREYDPHVPKVTVEKHKVLQILVNLIRNAKYACDESGSEEKRLTLRVSNGEAQVRITVSDNGVGIAPENLTRIFNHGFTTRKGGHGFGLHSGALAAKEMGGALLAQSEGPGKGATFTLELPLSRKN